MKQMLKRNDQESFSTMELATLFLFFMFEVNLELFIRRALYLAVTVFAYSALLVKQRGKIRITPYFWWILIWALSIATSLLYSINRSYTFTALITVLARGVLFILLISRVTSYLQLVQLMKLFVFCVFLNTCFILYRVDITTLGVSRIGAGTIQSDVMWNSNAIATILAFNVFAMIILLVRKHYIGFWKMVVLAFIAASIVIILLCGSRTALLLLVALPLMYYFLTSDIRNGIARILLIACILVGILWVLLNVEPIYNILGVRVERLINSILGIEGKIDGSISSRKTLIAYGKQWFLESPVWGHGMYTFMQKSVDYFAIAWYAHNNYYEIAVGLGVIGVAVYYWYYLYILRFAIHDPTPNGRLILATLIIIFVAEYASVSFKSFIYQLAIAVLSLLMELRKREKKIGKVIG